ncbi:MAG: Nif3-like dinuclear metal center hexameric protein [Candidatus Caldatribacteriaceae bacterium]
METIERVISFLENLFPSSFALPDDRIGLQIRAGDEVQKIAVDLELTPELGTWAIAEKVDLLYLHHPPIWTPFVSFSKEDPYFVFLQNLYQNGISVLVHHTNLDSAPHGLADQWIQILNLEGKKRSILPCSTTKFKVVTFIPPTHRQEVSEAIFSSGAGVIGNYERCSFFTSGTGTFSPKEGTHPFMGEVNAFQQVPEVRLEVEVKAEFLGATIEKIRSAHPYEEPAIDVYPLISSLEDQTGLGRIIELSSPLEKKVFQQRAESTLSTRVILHQNSHSPSFYRTIALCPGSGKSLLEKVIEAKADVFISGELSHHEIQKLLFFGIDYLQVPHDEGEKRAMQRVFVLLTDKAHQAGLQVEFMERGS